MKKYNGQCPTNERQTMRVETTGVCRGNWKIYQQLKIEGIHKGSSVTAQAATNDNRCLPLSLLKFRDNGCDSNSYVLVLPDPDARTIKIEFCEIGQDGRTLSSDSFHSIARTSNGSRALTTKLNLTCAVNSETMMTFQSLTWQRLISGSASKIQATTSLGAR